MESRTLLACEPVYVNEHLDIEVALEDDQLVMRLHDETNDQKCDPAETYLYVAPTSRTQQPAGWTFLGAGDGNPVWLLPQLRDEGLLYLGASAEEVEPNDFFTYRPRDERVTSAQPWIKITLRDVRGPGHVSAWQNGQAPNSWWVSSHDGGRTFDPSLFVPAGAHLDYNWGFSAPGWYEVDFEASGFRGPSGLPIRSLTTTYYFYVDDGTSPGNGGEAPSGGAEGLGGWVLTDALIPVTAAEFPAFAPMPPVVFLPTFQDDLRHGTPEELCPVLPASSAAEDRSEPIFAGLETDTLKRKW